MGAARARGVGVLAITAQDCAMRIDAGFGVGVGAERRAVVEEAAQVPVAIPAGWFGRVSQGCRACAPIRGERLPVAFPSSISASKRIDYGAEEPGEPDAFAAAFDTD